MTLGLQVGTATWTQGRSVQAGPTLVEVHLPEPAQRDQRCGPLIPLLDGLLP